MLVQLAPSTLLVPALASTSTEHSNGVRSSTSCYNCRTTTDYVDNITQLNRLPYQTTLSGFMVSIYVPCFSEVFDIDVCQLWTC